MNVLDLLKDNTDEKSFSEIFNAKVVALGKAFVPVVTTSVTANAASVTIVSTIPSGTIFTNTGDEDAQVITLPAAADCLNKYFLFAVTTAYDISLSPTATDSVYLFGSGVADKDLVITGVVGNYAVIYSDGTYWYCVEYNGVVTKEA